jgi:hypothetical protein
MKIFRNESYDSTRNVQKNLNGLTYYYEVDTMKCFKSRIVFDAITDKGLLLATVESFNNAEDKRRFRVVIFNVCGDVVNDRDPQFTNSKTAIKALWEQVDLINAKKETRMAIKNAITNFKREVSNFRLELKRIKYSSY